MAICMKCGKDIAQVESDRTGGYCDECEYLRIPEAEARLHVSWDTVMRWLRVGKLKRIKVGKHVLIRRADVERLLQG